MTIYDVLPTILLVEDSSDDYEATVRSFKKAHLNNPLHWCRSGKDALDYLNRTGAYASVAPYPTPGLILMDLNMPGLDGRKTLALIKENRDIKSIPIVILTTSADEKDVKHCYELGASTYVQKPVDFEGLIDAVRRMKDYWFGVALLPMEAGNAK